MVAVVMVVVVVVVVGGAVLCTNSCTDTRKRGERRGSVGEVWW